MNLDDYKNGKCVVKLCNREEWDEFQKILQESGLESYDEEISNSVSDREDFPHCIIYQGLLGGIGFDCEQYFKAQGYEIVPFNEATHIVDIKLYGIRNKKTGENFIGGGGTQSIWEKLGPLKNSFYQVKGVVFSKQDEWELVIYKCVEVNNEG